MITEQKNLNTKNAKHAYEFLLLISRANTADEAKELLAKWGAVTPLSMLLQLNFNTNVRFDFPEGAPPYKRDEETHPDLMAPLASQIHRLKACLVGNGIKKMTKERVLIQVLESIPPKDCDVLIAAKDKTLTELYPKITEELVKEVFPEYVK